MHAKDNRSVDNIGPPTASLRDRIMVQDDGVCLHNDGPAMRYAVIDEPVGIGRCNVKIEPLPT